MSAVTEVYPSPGEAFINSGHKDRRVTTCSACGLGVFQGQPWVFARKPHLGICHVSCVDGAR